LGNARPDVKENLEAYYEKRVYQPCAYEILSVFDDPGICDTLESGTFCVDPFGIQVRQRNLVALVFQGFRRFDKDQTARPSSSFCFCGIHGFQRSRFANWMGVSVKGHGAGPVQNDGRQFGGCVVVKGKG